jgi:hypothetical protein
MRIQTAEVIYSRFTSNARKSRLYNYAIVRFLDNSQKGVEQDIRYVKPIKL